MLAITRPYLVVSGGIWDGLTIELTTRPRVIGRGTNSDIIIEGEDILGDGVNIAARMESLGEPGKIQIAPGMYELIKDEFVCTPRGKISVKGRGELNTWFVECISSKNCNRGRDIAE